MLITRLWMGGVLILLTAGLLAFDTAWAPWYPFLMAASFLLAIPAALELHSLLPTPRPTPWSCALGVAVIIAANWPSHLLGQPVLVAWAWVVGALVVVLMAYFLGEAWAYREPGAVVARLGLAWFSVGYVGLLASFLLQVRWLAAEDGTLALALAVFVPKMGDSGAFFVGKLVGQHRMTPLLSPKKTWEGCLGGLAASVLAACVLTQMMPGTTPRPLWWAVAFGLTVGGLGQIGDLMESLVKRDSGRKDASQWMPGFGGVLDVLDSVLFSAPLSYLWFLVSIHVIFR